MAPRMTRVFILREGSREDMIKKKWDRIGPFGNNREPTDPDRARAALDPRTKLKTTKTRYLYHVSVLDRWKERSPEFEKFLKDRVSRSRADYQALKSGSIDQPEYDARRDAYDQEHNSFPNKLVSTLKKSFVFYPQIPTRTMSRHEYDDPWADHGYFTGPGEAFDPLEDTSTARVSFSPSIRKAIAGTGFAGDVADMDFAVFMPDQTIEVVKPSDRPFPEFYGTDDPSRWYVRDVDIVGEYWSLEPVRLVLVGWIRKGDPIPDRM